MWPRAQSFLRGDFDCATVRVGKVSMRALDSAQSCERARDRATLSRGATLREKQKQIHLYRRHCSKIPKGVGQFLHPFFKCDKKLFFHRYSFFRRTFGV